MGTGDETTAVKLVFDNNSVEQYELYEELEEAVIRALDPYYGKVALVSMLGVLKLIEQRLIEASD